VRRQIDLSSQIARAIGDHCQAVRGGTFPNPDESFD
jgi:ketopantoate hydroxymethyltransferase